MDAGAGVSDISKAEYRKMLNSACNQLAFLIQAVEGEVKTEIVEEIRNANALLYAVSVKMEGDQ